MDGWMDRLQPRLAYTATGNAREILGRKSDDDERVELNDAILVSIIQCIIYRPTSTVPYSVESVVLWKRARRREAYVIVIVDFSWWCLAYTMFRDERGTVDQAKNNLLCFRR
jgi:hypothetical protein